MSRLIDFYRRTRPTDEGYGLAQILAWPDEQIEAVHTFVQWLFPLVERSGANPAAPVLDEQDIAEFRRSPELRAMLSAAFVRMLSFYGLKLIRERKQVRVVRAQDFPRQALHWLTPANHNHLRITRILRSLTLLGLDEEARALLDALEQVLNSHPQHAAAMQTPLSFWRHAVTK